MKLPFVLPFCWIASLLGMEKPVVPVHLRVDQEKVEKDPSSYQDMPHVDTPKKHKRHSSQQIVATVTDEQGKELRIDIKNDGTLATSTDTNDSAKSGHSTKFVAVTNTITGVLTALIGAGVTLAVKYGDKKC